MSLSLLAKGERLLFADGGIVYKRRPVRFMHNELIKEVNGKVQQRMEKAIETSVEILDRTGRFVSFDFVDGTATHATFYSPEFKAGRVYSPYSEFEAVRGHSDSIICILANDRGSKCKLGILNFDGELISEKELEQQGYHTQNVCVNGGLVVFERVSRFVRGRIDLFCYDAKLKEQWRKELNYPVMNWAQMRFFKNNSMVFANNDAVFCMDVRSGQELWKLPKAQLLTAQYGFIEPIPVFNDEYVVIASSEYEMKEDEFLDNTITLVSSSDGSILSVEKLGRTKKKVELIPEKNGFIILKDGEYIRYSR